MRRFRVFARCVLVLTCLLMIAPLVAQEAVPYPIAAAPQGDLMLYALDGSADVIAPAEGQDAYSYPFWSPDGNLLGFMGWSAADNVTSLYMSDRLGRAAVNLVSGVYPALPASFSPDSAQIIYATTAGGGEVGIYSYAPAAASAPVLLGSYNYMAACPTTDSPLPMVRGLAVEQRALNGYPPVLALMPFGLLHSTSCLNLDLWLLNPANGRDTQLFPTADGVFISPDMTRVVVRNGNLLSFVNTPAGPYTQITPASTPDQIGFGLAGSNEIFYSTRDVMGQTPLTDEVNDQLSQILFNMPVNYHVTIHRFSLRTGVDSVVYEADAYGIGKMALTADGNTLVFSQIPNADAWVQAIADRRVAANDFAAGALFAQPEVYALSLADANAQLAGRNITQFALNSTTVTGALPLPAAPAPSYTPRPPVPTATYPPTLTPAPEGEQSQPTQSASGLSIGIEVTINTEIGTLNVRQRPGTGSRVVELMFGGEAVTILDGPQDFEGFTWWRIRLPDGAEGWVAETIAGKPSLVRGG